MGRSPMAVKVRVGDKGQVVIPKVFRKAYGIREGDEVILIPYEEGLRLRRRDDPDKVCDEILAWKRKVAGRPAKLGDLRSMDLEDELN